MGWSNRGGRKGNAAEEETRARWEERCGARGRGEAREAKAALQCTCARGPSPCAWCTCGSSHSSTAQLLPDRWKPPRVQRSAVPALSQGPAAAQ